MKKFTLFLFLLFFSIPVLAQSMGTLNIATAVENSDIFIDSVQVGRGSVVVMKSSGYHNVMVKLSDSSIICDRSIYVRAGMVTEVSVPYDGKIPQIPKNTQIKTSEEVEIKEATEPEEKKPSLLILMPRELEIKPEIYNFVYSEYEYMDEKGTFYGLYVSDSKYQNGVMDRGEFRFGFGYVKYRGAVVNVSTGDEEDSDFDHIYDLTWEFRWLRGNYQNNPDNSVTNTYFGLGSRILIDNLNESEYGYKRESNYLYLPLGLELIYPNGDRKNVLTLEYDLLITGMQISGDSDNNVQNRQNTGYGLRGSYKTTSLIKNKGTNFEVFIRYWNIEDSEIVEVESGGKIYNIKEPRNNTTEYGLAIIF